MNYYSAKDKIKGVGGFVLRNGLIWLRRLTLPWPEDITKAVNYLVEEHDCLVI